MKIHTHTVRKKKKTKTNKTKREREGEGEGNEMEGGVWCDECRRVKAEVYCVHSKEARCTQCDTRYEHERNWSSSTAPGILPSLMCMRDFEQRVDRERENEKGKEEIACDT